MSEAMPLVSVADLSDWVGEPIEDDQDQRRAGRVLTYAQTLVLTYLNRETVPAGEELPPAVSNVILQVAARGYTNPMSYANERLDDWGAGGAPVEEMGMYLTATEKRLLAPYVAGVNRTGLGVVGTYRGDSGMPGGWVPTEDGAPIPWY